MSQILPIFGTFVAGLGFGVIITSLWFAKRPASFKLPPSGDWAGNHPVLSSTMRTQTSVRRCFDSVKPGAGGGSVAYYRIVVVLERAFLNEDEARQAAIDAQKALEPHEKESQRRWLSWLNKNMEAASGEVRKAMEEAS